MDQTMTYDDGYLDFQREAEMLGTPPTVCALHSAPKLRCRHLPHHDPRQGLADPVGEFIRQTMFTPGGTAAYEPVPAVVDLVNHPPHYNSHPSGVQCIDITRHMTFDAGNAFKYVFRTDLKGGRQDIDKARWYLEDALRHADPVFLSSWRFKHQQLLDRVVAAETNPYRRAFFLSTTTGNVPQMLEAVNQILTDA